MSPTTGFSALVACLWLSTSWPPGATVAIDCDAGDTIGGALSRLEAGDTLSVSGTCEESVHVRADLVGITLDGGGEATIRHPGGSASGGPSRHVVFVRGRGITITGFTIRGGQDGVHLSGPAHAVIAGNVIVGNQGRGIHVDKASVAQVVDNTIAENGGAGINVTEGSYARIGFSIPPDERLRPNAIRDNVGDGVVVQRASSAWIVGNTIAGNQGNGISLDRSSEADIVANAIEGNGGDAIRATHNSGVNLRSEGTPRREGPNRTDPARENGGVAIRCSIGGYVDGPLGTLIGAQGAKAIDATCVDRVTRP